MSGPDSVARLIKSKLINANVFINRVIKHPKSLGAQKWAWVRGRKRKAGQEEPQNNTQLKKQNF